MSENRKLRGFKILKTARSKNLSLQLFAQNGTRYVVMATNYFLGIPILSRKYEFSSLSQAEYYFQRALHLKGLDKPILL